MSKTVYVEVKVELEDDVDVDEFQSEVDYSFVFPGVINTEITNVNEEDDIYRTR